MPSLSIIAVEGSAGEGASGSYSLPIYNVTPAPSLGSRSDTSISGKAFHTWGAVNFPGPTYAGVSNGYSEGSIPTGWYWINSANSGIQIKVGVSNTGFTFGPLKIAGSTIGQGSQVTGSSEKIWGLGTKSNSYGEVYYMFYSSRESIIGEGAKVYSLQFAFTFDGIADLITGDDPYGPAPGDAGAGSTPGGAGDDGSGDGFPDGTPSSVITVKTERLPGFLHFYLCNSAQIDGVVGAMWGGTSQSMFDRLWGKFQNYKFSPLAGIVSCHSLPGALTPAGGTATHIRAAGVDLQTIDANAVGSPISSLWTHYTTPPKGLGNPRANYSDYSHTSISVHLPFCGIVPIDVSAVMGGSVQVTYWCDVLTGNCAAWIIGIDRKGVTQLLKTATGNCAYRYPMFGNDNGTGAVISAITGMAQGTAELGGSIISGATQAATGGGLKGLPTNFDILGAAGKNAVQFATQVATAQHHTQSVGSLNGSCGFAGSTEIFLICDWQYPVESENFTTVRGRPSEVSGTVSSYGTGTYCELEVNPINITVATNEEKEEIRRLCASGVII